MVIWTTRGYSEGREASGRRPHTAPLVDRVKDREDRETLDQARGLVNQSTA